VNCIVSQCRGLFDDCDKFSERLLVLATYEFLGPFSLI
jgi:hypothetical protein